MIITTCFVLVDIHIYIYIYIYIHTYIYILTYYIVIVIVIVIFIWWSIFIPSRNLDEVFTYMALMSLRSRSHVKASMVLTRADHLFIHKYIRSLLNNILRPIL